MIKFIAHAITHFSDAQPLSLSLSLLSCSLPTTFGSVFNPVMHYHLDHSINTFRKELFSYQRLHLHETYKECVYSITGLFIQGKYKPIITQKGAYHHRCIQ